MLGADEMCLYGVIYLSSNTDILSPLFFSDSFMQTFNLSHQRKVSLPVLIGIESLVVVVVQTSECSVDHYKQLQATTSNFKEHTNAPAPIPVVP